MRVNQAWQDCQPFGHPRGEVCQRKIDFREIRSRWNSYYQPPQFVHYLWRLHWHAVDMGPEYGYLRYKLHALELVLI